MYWNKHLKKKFIQTFHVAYVLRRLNIFAELNNFDLLVNKCP